MAKTINQLLTKVSELEQIRDPLKFCFCGTQEQVDALAPEDRTQYQIFLIESEECNI